MNQPCELTILMPCLNEARTLPDCIAKAASFLGRSGVVGEIVVADNGSTDGSPMIAAANGARVVAVSAPGYGNALMGGIGAARGRYVIMGDSDSSYDFSRLDEFVARLRQGCDLVMGNRFKGGIMPGAMPLLHRYFGNPLLTAIGRLFFRSPCGDFYCGLRGFSRKAILGLDLQAGGMEFASEMVVKATISNLKITEVPTTLAPDGRGRPPHLRSWRDGWRGLRFLLLFCPRWLFLYPGLALAVSGLLAMAALLPGVRPALGLNFDIHTLLYASVSVVVGVQAVLFWMFAKLYGRREGLIGSDPGFDSIVRYFNLEVCLVAAVILLAIGIGLAVYTLGFWQAKDFGPLDPRYTMRLVIPSVTAILLAFQVLYGAFFMSLLGIRRRQ